jgi:K+-sensing histidine kinase KdpD
VKKIRFPFHTLFHSLLAMMLVMATTVPLWLLGRETLGEAVIALTYLVPVSWSAYRWGQMPGIGAALTASLLFNFLFIPPFFTFAIARLEGWLVLAIFVGVAIIVVEQIQSSIVKAREATFMYELSASLADARTPDAVARILTRQIQQLFQASLVRVSVRNPDSDSSTVVSQPDGIERKDRPDRVLPVLNSWGFVGEIRIWRGFYSNLPPDDGALLRNFAFQAGKAFERIQKAQAGSFIKPGM